MRHEQSAQREGAAESDSSVLADLIDALTAKMQAGEPIDWEGVARQYPEHAEEMLRLRPALGALGNLSKSGPAELSGLAAPAIADDGLATGVLGDFRIVREVGRGAMGVVYEAEQVSLGRRVALKVLPFAATMDPRALQRFQNEARAAACLHHTNVVPVYYVGFERGIHFYAMQFIDGQTLADLIRELRRPTGQASTPEERTTAHTPANKVADPKADTEPAARQSTLTIQSAARSREFFRRAAGWGVQAAEALDHAHQAAIVHRDVKPGNLLLDGRGQLWVADFGLAHVRQGEAGLTMTGDLVGTLRYMSPEQALAKRVPIDHRTDVYSLGATLYELLTLRPALTGKDRQELLRQIAFDEPTPPRRLNKAIPHEMEIIVLKAMEKNPAERYTTAQEMADDLRRFLDDKPIRARRPSWRQVAIKWVRRHRTATWASTAVLLVTVALAGAFGVWRLQQLAAAEREAEVALQEAGRLQDEEEWSEALLTIRRAETLRNTGLLGYGLRQRVEERLADLKMVDRLEQIRSQKAVLKEDGFDFTQAVSAYRDAFRDYGIDVTVLSVEETAGRIRARSIRVQLVAALDDWADVFQNTSTYRGNQVLMSASAVGWANGPVLGRKEMLGMARAADSDELRNELRDALEQGDGQGLKEATALEEVARLPSSTLILLGHALAGAGAVERAVAVLRDGQQRHPGDFWINYELAFRLRELDPPQLEEAVRFFTAAVALRPLSSAARIGLGLTLARLGRLDEAVAQYHKAIELKPDYARTHVDLANALRDKGRLGEAAAECRRAIELEPSLAREYFNRGYALQNQGQLNAAIGEYRNAITLDPKLAAPQGGLGQALAMQGRYAEAQNATQRCLELLPPGDARRQPATRQLQQFKQFLALNQKLAAILEDKEQPAEAERLALAGLCQQPFKKLNAASARFYGEAFAEKPQLAHDLSTGNRYNAACAAGLAGCGQGKDAGSLDEKERTRLRAQSLKWLQADLGAWRRLLEKEPDSNRPAIAQQLQHWLEDSDLAGVRGEKALLALPEAERPDWQKLWQEVEALRKQAAQQP
ncbi:MAG TPA: hypothetical protein DDY78_19830 [Planctomycetales bacterium]|nr:hypothetical protein [Planctomycetales bacterium]